MLTENAAKSRAKRIVCHLVTVVMNTSIDRYETKNAFLLEIGAIGRCNQQDNI